MFDRLIRAFRYPDPSPPVPARMEGSELVEELWEEPLDAFFSGLIAFEEQLPREQITLRYIVSEREQRPMPTDIRTSDHGGWDDTGLRVLSEEEWKAIEKRNDERLEALLAL